MLHQMTSLTEEDLIVSTVVLLLVFFVILYFLVKNKTPRRKKHADVMTMNDIAQLRIAWERHAQSVRLITELCEPIAESLGLDLVEKVDLHDGNIIFQASWRGFQNDTDRETVSFPDRFLAMDPYGRSTCILRLLKPDSRLCESIPSKKLGPSNRHSTHIFVPRLDSRGASWQTQCSISVRLSIKRNAPL
jgi:hypothetical protein